MALTDQWTFTVTRDDIIKEAMLNVGALGEGETPTAQEAVDCSRKLNMMIKQWMGTQDFAPGLKMWERQRAELFLTSSQGVYELGPNSPDNWGFRPNARTTALPYGLTFVAQDAGQGTNNITVTSVSDLALGDSIGIFIGPDIFWSTITAIAQDSLVVTIAGIIPAPVASGNSVYNYGAKAQRPLDIISVTLRDQFGNDTPVDRMTVQEYEALPSKVQPDFLVDPSAYYYESQFANGTSPTGGGLLFLDMFGAQDTNKHLHIVYIRPVMDMLNPTDNPEYPQQWYRALCWGLAREIVPMFDAEWTQEMEGNYDQSLAMAREADAETTSMYFQPNAWNEYGV